MNDGKNKYQWISLDPFLYLASFSTLLIFYSYLQKGSY
jgi:hypothetical protein